MNALNPNMPQSHGEPARKQQSGRRFPRLPLALGLGLLGFSVAAIAFGMNTGIGVMRDVTGNPEAIRDITIAGTHDTEITISDARSGETISTLSPDEGGFVRGSLRGLTRLRQVAGTPLDQPYRIIKWENGTVSLSDTATGERIYLNAFGPDHAAAYEQLLASRGNKKP
ncbi:photosynthetic complex assembly protein PuhC [Hoeflea sp.]|uniref:photosynthetic complex assembly protein PuhC n=1 Tax=Hoeflea sp. TaxID=1940281 RepID=UPI003B52D33C